MPHTLNFLADHTRMCRASGSGGVFQGEFSWENMIGIIKPGGLMLQQVAIGRLPRIS
jgi:hypothetical protein